MSKTVVVSTTALKGQLVNLVCASMIAEPKFDGTGTSSLMRDLINQLSDRDPEWVLKLALYVRDDLNIRSTANFLVALACDNALIAPYVRKYIKHIVRLPSDWLDIPALTFMLPDRSLAGSALPTALRKALLEKFPDFDAYQLGKYNKEGKIKRKGKKDKKLAAADPAAAAAAAAAAVGAKRVLTMKQMIRVLHISEPVPHVMSLLGKKYPRTQDEFWKARLPGDWEPARAGTRMKLPIPETWETLVSAKGNKAATWEELIDHKKLPFMAMLRNLRNLILAGVSHKHHQWVLGKLTNERSVAQSRQFPFAFFSAYEAVNVDLDELKKDIAEAKALAALPPAVAAAAKRGRAAAAAAARGGRGGRGGRGVSAAAGAEPARRAKKTIIPVNMPDAALIKRYRDALDTAVKFATVHNVRPIRGSTAVFCSVALPMRQQCKTAKGMGSVRTTSEVGILLGLMCKYMCEQCDFRIFSSSSATHPDGHASVPLREGTILDNMRLVLDEVAKLGDGQDLPLNYLEQLILTRHKVDQIIVMCDRAIVPSAAEDAAFGSLLTKYRQEVNPHLLFVSVNLTGAKSIGSGDEALLNPNDVNISGFSDAILKYVAERGSGDQLLYLDRIDKIKGVPNRAIALPKNALSLPKPVPLGDDGEETGTSGGGGGGGSAAHGKAGKKSSAFGSSSSSSSSASKTKPFGAGHNGGLKVSVSKKPLAGSAGYSSPAAVAAAAFVPAATAASAAALAASTNAAKARAAPPAPAAWQTARVFVSSTFLDMHGERDVLVHKVFPALRERCAARRIVLREIDLRWGITAQESESNTSLSICLTEVERCRPFFLGMLGERYGYCPSSYDVPDEPEYEWVKTMPEGRSVTELEMWAGALREPEAAHGAFFYLRDNAALARDVPHQYQKAFASESPTAAKSIKRLKSSIRDRLPAGHVRDYPATWGGDLGGMPSAAGLDQFARMVTDDLWAAISARFPPESIVHLSPLDELRSQHDAALAHLSRSFVGRHAELQALFNFCDGVTPGPLALLGAAGEGKSALLASFAAQYAKLRPHTHVVAHFVGSAPHSTDVRHALHRLSCELFRFQAGGEVAEAELAASVPNGYPELRQAFPRLVEQAASAGRVVVLVDGVSRFTLARAQTLEWLPTQTPARVVISATTESAAHAVVAARRMHTVTLPPMSEPERRQLVRSALWEFRKKLDESPQNNQMRFLVKKADGALPLYLAIAVEELRVFGVYEQLTGKLRKLGETLPRLCDDVLARFESQHGRELVRTAFSLLVVSRDGLLESELQAMLGRGEAFPLAAAQWSALLRSLEPFLRPTGGSPTATLALLHQAMVEAVRKRYLRTPREAVRHVHGMLARFFYAQLTGGRPSVRAVAELPHHLAGAQQFEQAEQVVCNLQFIHLKAHLGMAYDLAADAGAALAVAREVCAARNKPLSRRLVDYERFITSSTHLLARDPARTMQLAANQPDRTSVAFDAHNAHRSGAFHGPWLRWLNKPQQADPCVMTLALYSEPVLACAVSPDGARMLTATARAVKVWDTKSGAELLQLAGHTQTVETVAWSPNGAMLATGAADNTLKLWDAETGALVRTLANQHQKKVTCCAFSADSARLISGSYDCTAIVWNVANGEVHRTLRNHTKPLNAVAFSPNGLRAATASWDMTVRVWEIDEPGSNGQAKQWRVLSGHRESVRSVTFSPTGSNVVSTSVDHSIVVWELATGIKLATLSGHTKAVNTVSFSDDGRCLVSASDDKTVRLWDILGGRQVSWFRAAPEDHAQCLAYSHDGKMLACGLTDCTIALFDAQFGSSAGLLTGHTRTINSLSFSADGRYLLSASDDHTARIFDVHQRKQVLSVVAGREGCGEASWSPDHKQFATGCDDHTAKVWNVATGALALELPDPHSAPVKSVRFSPNGKLIATGGRDSLAKIWEASTGRLRATLRGHMDWVTRVRWSPDNLRLLTGSWDFTALVWDVRTGQIEHKLSGHKGAVSTAVWVSSGAKVVTASYDGTLKLWRADNGEEVTAMAAHSAHINDLAVSPDERYVASCAEDHTVRTWDIDAGSQLAAYFGHHDSVRQVQYSSATHTVTSAAEDSSVRVWNTGADRDTDENADATKAAAKAAAAAAAAAAASNKDHQPAAAAASASSQLTYHGDVVTALAFSPDGSHLASVGRDRAVLIYSAADARQTGATDVHPAVVGAVCFASGAHLATGDDQGSIRLWDIQGGQLLRQFSGHTSAVKALAAAPDGTTLASAAWDSTVRLWNLQAGASSARSVLTGHRDWVNAVAYHQSGDMLASGSHDRSVRLWSSSGQARHAFNADARASDDVHQNWVLGVAFAPRAPLLASVSYEGRTCVWDTEQAVLERTIALPRVERLNACAFSPDGELLAVASGAGLVRLYDRRAAEPVCEFFTKGPAICVSFADASPRVHVAVGDGLGNVAMCELEP